MSYASDNLNDYIAILRDGILFYEHAAKKVNDPGLKELFGEMIMLREKAICELSPIVREEGLPVRPMGTLTGQLHEGYTNLKALLSDAESTYLKELSVLETRTISAFEKIVPHLLSTEQRGRMTALHDSFRAACAGMHNMAAK